MELTTETFRHEIDNAMLSYDRHVVCVFKTPDECLEAIERLIIKAIKAYENRAEGMRHGIALDKEITIMLSQSESDQPLCAIYFNLHTPYGPGQRVIRGPARTTKLPCPPLRATPKPP